MSGKSIIYGQFIKAPQKREIEKKQRVIVGVNDYARDEKIAIPLLEVKDEIVDEIKKVFKERKAKIKYLIGTMIEVNGSIFSASGSGRSCSVTITGSMVSTVISTITRLAGVPIQAWSAVRKSIISR